MGGRKQKPRALNAGIYIIGEGITEQYYFSHLKRLFGLHCTIKPRFFGNTSFLDMKKKMEALLSDDILTICVFDADTSLYNEAEKRRLIQLQNKYQNNKNVIFCDSMPSIEFWFLLHYIETNRHFNNSELENLLRKYIQGYQKTASFLEKEEWIIDMCTDRQLETAIQRAKKCLEENGSYSNVWKAVEVLFKNK